MLYRTALELTVLAHFLFILFVLFGALFTRERPLLRWLHWISLSYGVLVEVFNWYCPLTLGPYLEEPGGMSSRVWRRRWIAGLLWIRAFEGSRSGGGRGQLRPSYGI